MPLFKVHCIYNIPLFIANIKIRILFRLPYPPYSETKMAPDLGQSKSRWTTVEDLKRLQNMFCEMKNVVNFLFKNCCCSAVFTTIWRNLSYRTLFLFTRPHLNTREVQRIHDNYAKPMMQLRVCITFQNCSNNSSV